MKSDFGRGSRFSVEVPRAAVAAPATEPARARKFAAGQLTGTVVVCIDNEPAILDGMQTLLGGWGCRVLTAENLAQAQAALEAAVSSPTAFGRLPSRRLERRRRHQRIAPPLRRDLPAILVTADRSAHVREEARAVRRARPQQAGQARFAARADHTMARAARRRGVAASFRGATKWRARNP